MLKTTESFTKRAEFEGGLSTPWGANTESPNASSPNPPAPVNVNLLGWAKGF